MFLDAGKNGPFQIATHGSAQRNQGHQLPSISHIRASPTPSPTCSECFRSYHSPGSHGNLLDFYRCPPSYCVPRPLRHACCRCRCRQALCAVIKAMLSDRFLRSEFEQADKAALESDFSGMGVTPTLCLYAKTKMIIHCALNSEVYAGYPFYLGENEIENISN
jgi:hypothetical protein